MQLIVKDARVGSLLQGVLRRAALGVDDSPRALLALPDWVLDSALPGTVAISLTAVVTPAQLEALTRVLAAPVAASQARQSA